MPCRADEAISDADIARLIDRGGAAGAAAAALEVGCAQTAADFKPEQPLMLTQALQGQAVASGHTASQYGVKKKTMSELAREWESAVEVSGKRKQTSRLQTVGGQQVLKLNAYGLGGGLSVFAAEQRGQGAAMAEPAKGALRKLQQAGRDRPLQLAHRRHLWQCSTLSFVSLKWACYDRGDTLHAPRRTIVKSAGSIDRFKTELFPE